MSGKGLPNCGQKSMHTVFPLHPNQIDGPLYTEQTQNNCCRVFAARKEWQLLTGADIGVTR